MGWALCSYDIRKSHGNLYGSTITGANQSFFGTIYRFATNGTFNMLCSIPYGSGAPDPEGALTLGNDGSFYGTTERGGYLPASSYGTIFNVTTNGLYSTIAYFSGANGELPQSALALGNDGAFYGATQYGGYTNNSFPSGMGTIFKVTPNGLLRTLFVFPFTTTNGINPIALTLGTDGAFTVRLRLAGLVMLDSKAAWAPFSGLRPMECLLRWRRLAKPTGQHPMPL